MLGGRAVDRGRSMNEWARQGKKLEYWEGDMRRQPEMFHSVGC